MNKDYLVRSLVYTTPENNRFEHYDLLEILNKDIFLATYQGHYFHIYKYKIDDGIQKIIAVIKNTSIPFIEFFIYNNFIFLVYNEHS